MEQTREKKDICVHKRYDIYMGVGGEGGEWEYSLIPAHSIIYIYGEGERERVIQVGASTPTNLINNILKRIKSIDECLAIVSLKFEIEHFGRAPIQI